MSFYLFAILKLGRKKRKIEKPEANFGFLTVFQFFLFRIFFFIFGLGSADKLLPLLSPALSSFVSLTSCRVGYTRAERKVVQRRINARGGKE